MAELYVSWVEIPVRDLDRALAFYRAVLQLPEIEVSDDGTRRTAVIYHGGEDKPGVSLNQTANFEPGDKGPLMYFQVGKHNVLTAMLERVASNGGTVTAEMTEMGGGSNYGMFRDSEGNTIALSSYEATEAVKSSVDSGDTTAT